jgi:hypothetical protein
MGLTIGLGWKGPSLEIAPRPGRLPLSQIQNKKGSFVTWYRYSTVPYNVDKPPALLRNELEVVFFVQLNLIHYFGSIYFLSLASFLTFLIHSRIVFPKDNIPAGFTPSSTSEPKTGTKLNEKGPFFKFIP